MQDVATKPARLTSTQNQSSTIVQVQYCTPLLSCNTLPRHEMQYVQKQAVGKIKKGSLRKSWNLDLRSSNSPQLVAESSDKVARQVALPVGNNAGQVGKTGGSIILNPYAPALPQEGGKSLCPSRRNSLREDLYSIASLALNSAAISSQSKASALCFHLVTNWGT